MDTNQLGLRHTYARVPSSENVNNYSETQFPIRETYNSGYDDRTSGDPARNDTYIQPFDIIEPITKSSTWNNITGSKTLKSWQKGVLASACMASAAFAFNIAALIWFVKSPRSEEGFTQLYRGNCGTVKSLELWLHLAINILSTILLGASNYCMQCLASPNRREVDVAHGQGRWVDIGIPSLRNFRRLSKRKALVWSMLGLSSVPLHLLYNSAFFAAYQANEYQIAIADESFTTGASYDLAPISQNLTQIFGLTDPPVNYTFNDIAPAQKLQSPWTYLTNEECIDAYTRFYVTAHRNLILISPSSTQVNDSLNLFPSTASCDSCGSVKLGTYAGAMDGFLSYWPCSNMTDFAECPIHTQELLNAAADWTVFGYPIDHCIAEKVDEQCIFNGSITVITLVAVCNFIKAASMFFIFFHFRGQPFLVVGDAIASFLSNPDPSTKNMCLLSQADVTQGKIWPSKTGSFGVTSEAMVARLPAKWRFRSVSKATFWLTCIVFLSCAITTAGGFGYVYRSVQYANDGQIFVGLLSKFQLSAFGFGSPAPQNTWLIPGLSKIQNPDNQVLVTVLLANLPQLLLSFVYLILNRYLTAIYVADEWSDYAIDRKGLRVSQPIPHSQQRSTYFLQLPYRIGLPLMCISTVAHWLASATVFLAIVRVFDHSGRLILGTLAYIIGHAYSNGPEDPAPMLYAALGFSPAPLAFLLATFALMLLCLLFVSLRKIRAGMPIAGSCSAAISAACHLPLEDRGAETKALLWGNVNEDKYESLTPEKPGHCCFSSISVEPVVQNAAYS